MPDDTPLLEVKDLKVKFPIRGQGLFEKQKYFEAVKGVSFKIHKGEIFGLVGESGCGKSTIARTIVRLNNPSSGEIYLNGKNISTAKGRALLELRRDVQMIFQDPYASLNPRMTVADIISEPLYIFRGQKLIDISDAEIEKRIDFLLERVGLRHSMKKRFPHEFSGGQRQRIGIARAIAIYPKLIIADEPISALDVSVQAQILNLLKELQDDFHLTYLFIAHDLTVVNYISNKIGVMYLGKMMEYLKSGSLIEHSINKPQHPYSQMLLDAVLVPDPSKKDSFSKKIEGEIDSDEMQHSTRGCLFYNRCSKRMDLCAHTSPKKTVLAEEHALYCHLFNNKNA